jgi:hypothetical protein
MRCSLTLNILHRYDRPLRQAFDRAVELLDLTIADARWKGRRKELTRARELLCNAMFGGHTYGSDLASLDRYFFHFAMAARVGR